jgi:uncharacterized protein YkwD
MVRLMLVAAVVVFGGAAAMADGKKVEKKDKDAKVQIPDELREILTLVNKERAKKKLPALTLDPTLCKVAAEYSKLMAKKGKREHRLDGKTAGQRVEAAGYDWLSVAENLADAVGKGKPAPKPADLVEGWMKSTEHRENILNGKHTQTGLGVALSQGGDFYYTQVFASPQKAVKGALSAEQQLQENLTLVNEERAKKKLPALKLDPTLCKAAQQYAELMAKQEKCAPRLDGKKVGDRVAAAGYAWKTLDENLASPGKAAAEPAELVEFWMQSEGRRESLLNGKHVHTGLGVARSKSGVYYYAQLFASPGGK